MSKLVHIVRVALGRVLDPLLVDELRKNMPYGTKQEDEYVWVPTRALYVFERNDELRMEYRVFINYWKHNELHRRRLKTKNLVYTLDGRLKRKEFVSGGIWNQVNYSPPGSILGKRRNYPSQIYQSLKKHLLDIPELKGKVKSFSDFQIRLQPRYYHFTIDKRCGTCDVFGEIYLY